MGIDFFNWSKRTKPGQIPPVFPNRWVKSCMAMNAIAKTIDWVVEGVAVLALKSENLTEFKKFPKSFERKLILGATFLEASGTL